MNIQEIPLNKLEPNPFQTREDFPEDTIAAIAISLVTSGLRNIITVRPHPEKEGWFQIGSGELRSRAARTAGWETITANVVEMDDADMALEVLIENVHRKDLTWDERVKALQQIVDDPPKRLTEREREKLKNKSHGFLVVLQTVTG